MEETLRTGPANTQRAPRITKSLFSCFVRGFTNAGYFSLFLTRLVFHEGLGIAGSGNSVFTEEEDSTELRERVSVECCNGREPLRWTQLCVMY